MAASQPIKHRCDFQDLTGRRFGRWLVIRDASTGHGPADWECLCDCGTIRIVRAVRLRNGTSTSCGCWVSEKMRVATTTHDNHNTKAYFAWQAAKWRCLNPAHRSFANYGGRGIKICKRWLKFENFLKDMGNPPTKRHSLDRFPDNNGDYKPGNCRWATTREQHRNMRTNRLLTFRGETMCLTAWSERLGIKRNTIRSRLDYQKLSIAEALTMPLAHQGKRPN